MTITLPEVEGIPQHLEGLVAARGTQHGRTLKVVMLVNMPNKADTEADACRFFGSLPGNYELVFRRAGERWPSNLDPAHAERMGGYAAASEKDVVWSDIVLPTGTPIEHRHFDKDIKETTDANTRIYDLIEKHDKVGIYWCWSGFAAFNHRYDEQPFIALKEGGTTPLPQFPDGGDARNIYGIYTQPVADEIAAHTGLATITWPVSRRALLTREQFEKTDDGFVILASDDESGVGLAWHPESKSIYCFNHPEYEFNTLLYEYVRNAAKLLEEKGIAYPRIAIDYARKEGTDYPDFLKFNREHLVTHAVLVAETLRSNGLDLAPPHDYPLTDATAQKKAQQDYVAGSSQLFGHLLAEAGLIEPQARQRIVVRKAAEFLAEHAAS